jgi:hypothetical protein
MGINSQIPPIQNIPPSNSPHMANISNGTQHIPGLGNQKISNSSNKNGNNGNNPNMQNMMFYQNLNNNFIGYNGANNIPINPMIYNNSNINNYSNVYQPYDYNYFGGFYPNSGNSQNSKPNGNSSNSSKDMRFNGNQN